MKRIMCFITVLIVSMATVSVSAQDSDVAFNPHWDLKIQAGVSYTQGAGDFSDLISPAAALSVGYQFTPVFSLRLGASGWQGRGGFVSSDATYKYNYIQANLDASFDILNLFCGYKYDRLFSPYIFGGIGFNHSFNNDAAVALYNNGAKVDNIWRKTKNLAVGRLGIGTDIRLSDRVALNAELNTNFLSDKFNSKDNPRLDWQYNALVGVKIKFGKSYTTASKPQEAPAHIASEPAEKPAERPAPKPAEKPAPKPAEKPAPKPVEKPAPAPVVKEAKVVNIFFAINSSQVSSDQKSKIDEIVSYLNSDSEANVSLIGYADLKSGNAAYNAKISKLRSERVRDAIIAKGISSSRIITDSKGDVEQPFSDNDDNRVVVCVVK